MLGPLTTKLTKHPKEFLVPLLFFVRFVFFVFFVVKERSRLNGHRSERRAGYPSS